MLSVFTVISIPVIIPFFQLLFDRQPDISKSSGIEAKLNSLFSSLISTYGKEQSLVIVCGLIIVVFFLKNIFRYLALYFIVPVRNGIVRDVRADLFSKFVALPISFYNEERKGDLMSRATSDVQEVEWSILNVIESLFKAPIIIIGCLVFMIMISVKLSIFVFVLLLFTVLIIGGVGRSLRSTSSLAQVKLGELSAILEESLNGLRIIKAFNGEKTIKQKFEQENESHFNTLNKILYRRDLAAPLSEFLGITTVAVLLWYGTSLVFKNELSPETFFAFVFAFYQIIEPAKYFSQAIYNVQKGRSAMDRINKILDYDIKNTDRENAEIINVFEKIIEFKNVSFIYDNSVDYALKHINLIVNKGDKIALVGPSGGGKSTLMDLLIRFQECTSGEILIDGKNILNLNTESYRNLFGVVTQEAILFNDSIENNVTFGSKNDKDNIDRAIKAANAHIFIYDNNEGLKYNIGDKGNKLSGGQKQRLTIARAIYKNPPIMILDEATSSLDSESEKIVQEAIDHIMEDRTSFVIAHRLSTIKKADKIIVINKGRIEDIGTHESLMNTCELYKTLVNNQNL